MTDLSILIPARNEIWLKNTVEDILKNIEMDTEIIVTLDGQWANPPLEQNPRVKVIYVNESIGQRAGQNLACRISNAKYVMKVDAHCSFDKGFDRKMIEAFDELGEEHVTMVPAMKNLHIFDWVCKECGERRYQGPTDKCRKCGGEEEKDVVWFAKPSPYSTSYRVNPQLEFKYFGEYKSKQEGDLVETMSLQGSCFMATRENYWKYELCDESWGSWGGQGAEASLKTWLSGGRVIVNKRTWYAHLFRTQGADFGFPYPNPGSEQRNAKNKLREIFLNDAWPKATRKLSWLVEKFNAPEWEQKKGIIYYTDNRLPIKLSKMCQKQIQRAGLPISSCSLKPMPHFGDNVVHKGEPGRESYYQQILKALENSNAEVVYFCEHDVLYHPSHFDFMPPTKDKFYFNLNVYKWKYPNKHYLKVDDCKQVSGMVCYREKALEFYRQKVKDPISRHYEPREEREGFNSEYPNIDIRHDKNMTKNRWDPSEFKRKKYTKGWTVVDTVEGWNGL